MYVTVSVIIRAVKMGRVYRAGPKKTRKMKGLDNQILARLVRGLFSPSPYKPVAG